jgi:hypothetical protein
MLNTYDTLIKFIIMKCGRHALFPHLVTGHYFKVGGGVSGADGKFQDTFS